MRDERDNTPEQRDRTPEKRVNTVDKRINAPDKRDSTADKRDGMTVCRDSTVSCPVSPPFVRVSTCRFGLQRPFVSPRTARRQGQHLPSCGSLNQSRSQQGHTFVFFAAPDHLLASFSLRMTYSLGPQVTLLVAERRSDAFTMT